MLNLVQIHLCDQGISHPLVPKGDSMGPPKKTTFPAEFCDEYYTIYLYTKNNHIQAKEFPPRFFVSQWRPNDRFLSASFRFRQKFKKKKNTFPKEFFNEIWLIIGDYEYINIAEIKIWNF